MKTFLIPKSNVLLKTQVLQFHCSCMYWVFLPRNEGQSEANACENKEKNVWFEDQKVIHELIKGNVKQVKRQLGYVYTIIFMGFLWISFRDP